MENFFVKWKKLSEWGNIKYADSNVILLSIIISQPDGGFFL